MNINYISTLFLVYAVEIILSYCASIIRGRVCRDVFWLYTVNCIECWKSKLKRNSSQKNWLHLYSHNPYSLFLIAKLVATLLSQSYFFIPYRKTGCKSFSFFWNMAENSFRNSNPNCSFAKWMFPLIGFFYSSSTNNFFCSDIF